MRNVEELKSCHDNFKDTAAQVVGKEHIRVQLEELGDESFQHLSLGFECLHGSVVFLLELLLKIERPRLFI